MRATIYLFLGLFSFAILSSCTTQGCTFPQADNYNPDATNDDGSCRFVGCTDPNAKNYDPLANTPSYQYGENYCQYEEVVNFYISEDAANDWNNDGITTISVYLDNEEIGKLNTDEFHQTTPICGASKMLEYRKDLDLYYYSIHLEHYLTLRDQNGGYINSEYVYTQPGVCIVHELK